MKDNTELINETKELFEVNRKAYGKKLRHSEKALEIEYEDIAIHCPELAEKLIEEPEETIKLLELALEETAWANKNAKIRLLSLPVDQEIAIRNLRSKHLGKMICVDGIIRRASEIRPIVTNIKFECSSCGTIMSILQVEKEQKTPTKCACGRKGGFKEISKDMVDSQIIVVEENSDNLEDGGDQPKRLNILLQDDLTDPHMSKKISPGSRVKIIGRLKEVKLGTNVNKPLTRYDIAIEANNIIPMEEDAEDKEITEEDEKEIRDLAARPDLMEYLGKSIAPSVYGNEEIKKALTLQLFGGVPMLRSDGSYSREQIHGLLVGDPGVAKSVILKYLQEVSHKSRYVSGKSASGVGLCVAPDSKTWVNGELVKIGDYCEKYFNGVDVDKETEIKLNNGVFQYGTLNEITSVWKIPVPNKMVRVTTSSGKKIELTQNTRIMTPTGWKYPLKLKNNDRLILKNNALLGNKDINLLDYLSLDNFMFKDNIGFVDKVNLRLKELNITKREISIKTNINENKLYHSWNNRNIHIHDAKKMLKSIGLKFSDIVKDSNNLSISRRNGTITQIPLVMSNDFAYFIGLIFGDGNVSIDENDKYGSVRLSLESDMIPIYSKLCKRLFGLDVKAERDERAKDLYSIRINRYDLAYLLNVIGVKDKSHIPAILYKNAEHMKYFISGFFDTDGSVYKIKDRKTGTERIRVSISQSNVEVIDELSIILESLDIIGRTRFRDGKISTLKDGRKINGSGCKELLILDVLSIKNFKEIIGFGLPRKKKLLNDINNMGYKFNGVSNLSRRKYVNVKSIEQFTPKYKYVYDFTIKESHAFNVNNLEIHNTATVVKDELTGGYALEAGAMVLANKGSLFIDEFEKMSEEDRSNLHEGMSLGTISVSKASIQAKLNARTSILAAANPKFGRFDVSKPFASQINLAPSLLSRFDFIFVMRDVPEEIRDSMIADKIFGEHSTDRNDDILDKDMFKKYVAFAKSYKPKMGASALKILKEYYINLRKKTKVVDGKKVIPIGARQLEGLIRFSEASAKIRLRRTIISEDANTAIEVMESYLKEIGYDKKNDTFDVDAIGGNGIQSRNKVGTVMNVIKIFTKETGISVEIDKIKSALSSSIDSDEVDTVIEKLVRNGEAFRPTRGIIQLM